ncbi:hypothetical protein BAUCODRAFT_33532 [Baudoinia panamericana UAMH 10762]|uniref:Uncharacterized protein n=1 Tax=Baudoinia panamericana (strain UAMH 10762) TaxID=717646 RepID=M2LP84_BAUPA|nr:uncharacterized protein BAUCODRAFT_33532 [Baudoinia panamericana UAMH 10762]EMC96192.1 hypothetical protein BAUCODRAFT_33532 [Baudoinia panamericana UAMH 10762]
MASSGFTGLARRNTNKRAPLSHTIATLLVVLLVLITIALLLTASLLLMRYRRRRSQRQQSSSLHCGDDEKRTSTSSTSSHHRRVMVRPSESTIVYQEKQRLIEDSSAPPSPSAEIPEIRLTFPEEYDEAGKRQSGRVVVVHVGETSVGLEPAAEKLPAYGEDARFQSLDLERIGGLVENKAPGTPARLAS